MSDKKTGFFAGKGYYIALVLCAAAIGISGYVYYNHASDDETLQQGEAVMATDERMNPTTAPTLPEKPGQDATTSTEEPAGAPDACSPVDGQIVAGYAMECLSYNQTTRDWRVHNGVDLAANAGTEVVAAADGQVYTVYDDDEMGMTVVIRHEGGYVTKYSSLAENVTVSAGDPVEMGQLIGYVGNSALMETAVGDHLHFAVTLNDEPVDPVTFIQGE